MIAWVAAAFAQDGEIVGVVFRADGVPVPAEVGVGERVVRAGPDGVFRLASPAGSFAVSIDAGPFGSTVVAGVGVLSGQTTELLVTVGLGEVVVTVESPVDGPAATDLPTGPPGTLDGIVTDDAGQPLGSVRLFVRGSAVEATTDAQGRFSLVLPGGGWDLSAVRAGYGTETVGVEVASDERRAVSVVLVPAGLVLDDLTVKAPKITGNAASLLDERQESSTVSDVLGAEQMSRAGDTDAAAALRRVTGLTVVGGKYVYVRGLGDRYSATLLDGSSLPSPEPEKRVVPLDLFPAALLEAVVVQKTFSPNRPAEFGGGVVEVRTRAIPKEPTLQLSASGGYVSGTTGAQGLVGARGPTDWLGLGAGFRALPPSVAAASDDQPIKAGGIFSDDGYSAEELETLGEAIENRWGFDPRALPPDLGATVTGGGSVRAGATDLGALAGVVFSNGWDLEEGFRKSYSTGSEGLQLKRQTNFAETSNRVRLGGALAVGADSERRGLRSTTLVMRNSTGSALQYAADDPTGSADTESGRIDWVEQQLVFEQLALRQELGPTTLAARYAFARATGLQPDRRDYTYNVTDSGPVLSQRGSWSEILYTSLVDVSHDVGVDWTVPIERSTLSTGFATVRRQRTSTTRRFGFQFQGSEGIDLSAPIEDVIVPENIGAEGTGDPGYLELEENTTSSDDYTARQRLMAGYLMGDVAWTERLSTLVGARVEASTQQVETFELFSTDAAPVSADLTTTDLLPALTATLAVGPADEPDRMLVRAGYGRTLSRPEFRELSEVAFFDYRSGRLLYGNPDLDRATIDNLDLRWEWYPTQGESVSAGVFYKQFHHPIESIVAVSAVSGSVGTFDNATGATNLGAEVDLRKRLVSDLWFTTNASAIASSVDLSGTDGNQTSDERPLQGQSPWVANAQLSWEDPETRRNLALLYNAFGPRIVDVGTSGIPDTYELPVHRVDLVVSQGVGSHWTVRARGANLLDWPSRERTGDAISEELRNGWSLGLSASWSP
ncbi:MAG: TonB-dependent receptor [Myxococcota bacterium]